MYLLRLAVMIVPLGLYFLYLAWMNGRRHPTVSTGTRDLAVLSVGLIGLVAVGPLGMVLLFPGRWWGDVSLIAMVAALVGLVLSSQPPTVVVYNVDRESLGEALSRALERLQWAHDEHGAWVALPSHRAALDIGYFAAMRNATIRIRGARRSHALARRLCAALRCELAGVSSPGRFAGRCFLLMSMVLLVWPAWLWLAQVVPLAQYIQKHLGGG